MYDWDRCPNTEALDRFEMKQLRESEEERYNYYYDEPLEQRIDLIEKARFEDQAKKFYDDSINIIFETIKAKVNKA